MATIKEQIDLIRAEIDKTQKNKATNAHIGKLKAKIANPSCGVTRIVAS